MLEWLIELRETFISTSLLKDMIKDTDEQSDEGEGRVWEGSQHRSFCTHGLGVLHLLCPDMFTSLEALFTLYCWDFMAASSHRHDRSFTPYSALLPS